ncbi:cofilin/tropomyosin-type actin-binding protein [Auriculariales sp. MPI-PUGE-AT-0066]|nr:cofilin/tropomyosin-type actin-binding protein [Auriculariales sp. MPI-PUGE-AT-0066]
MAGADSTDILAAYETVRNDKEEMNWLLISYTSGSKVELTATGSGGLAELAEKLDPKQAQYAYARVEYANDSESTRVKFVFITWLGEQCPVMRKARVSVESGGVKQVLHQHHINIEARDVADIEETAVVTRLRKAGGADYNGGRG